MSELPKKKINPTSIRKPEEIDEFELFPMTIERILVDPHEGALVVLGAKDKQVAYPLNAIEGTMLVFVHSQCASKAHINTIYHLFLSTYRDLGMTLESATIEAKDGDVFYGRLKWKNRKGQNIYSQCSGGDCIVLSRMSGSKLNIVKKVLDDMDSFTLEYEDDIYD